VIQGDRISVLAPLAVGVRAIKAPDLGPMLRWLVERPDLRLGMKINLAA
jgi:hypothetical protein